uniref:Peroxisome assembly protein 12 n=1 Tax=Arcella intermedia TaxID=1963864 RepID=A0A6B2L9Q4_9EUKA
MELFLESQMVPSLKPALEWILQVAMQNRSRLYPVLQYIDEIFYGMVFVLERHYLKYYDSSFSENFYGLKRIVVTEDGTKGAPLQKKHKLWSLFFLVVVPYIKTKLDKYYEKNFTNPRPGSPPPSDSAKRFFKLVYPYVVAIYEATFFLYQILYMYDYTQYYNPFFHLMGFTVKRQTLPDIEQIERKEKQKRLDRMKQSGFFIQLYNFVSDIFTKTLDYSQTILITTIFFFKFLEWWSQEPRFQQTDTLTPPPPSPPKRAPGGLPIPKEANHCPICNETRTNPCMAISGFVFCYSCLHKYVEENKRCPITFMPMEIDQIRRLYDDQIA